MNRPVGERFSPPGSLQDYEIATQRAIPEKCLKKDCNRAKNIAFYAATDYRNLQIELGEAEERTRLSIVELCGIGCEVLAEPEQL